MTPAGVTIAMSMAPVGNRLIYPKGKRRVHPGAAFHDKVKAGAAHIAAPNHGVLLFNGRCEDPITMRCVAQGADHVGGPAPPGVFDTVVRCRKCPACLRFTRAQWTTRAAAEMVQADRNWFGTLTVEPHRRYVCQARAAASWGPEFGPGHPQFFQEMWAELARECQLWLKRVRKSVPDSRLRFMLVAEPHSDGFPHAHLLIHEVEGRVTYRQLRAAWHWGFSQFTVVRDPARARHYAAKYIAKGPGARVRASIRYGAWRMAKAVPHSEA